MKLTSSAMRAAARRIRMGQADFICFAVWPTHEYYDQVQALLRRDGLKTSGNFDDTEAGYEKQLRRAAWCDKIADELEAQDR